MESSRNISPSNKSPSTNRRRKGEGNGSIHWRTRTWNGKNYPQAYYHWRENGRKRTKYIPKQLLGNIQAAEAAKRPVIEILGLLGVTPATRKNTLLGDTHKSPSTGEEQLEIFLVKKALVQRADIRATVAARFTGKPLLEMAKIILKPGITMNFGTRAIG